MHSLRIRNILAFVALLALAAGGAMLLLPHVTTATLPAPGQAMLPSPESCQTALGRYTLGPAKSIEAAENDSLSELKASPGTPQVPFGYRNREWEDLKANVQPGDTLHEASTETTGGGLLLVRHGCIVGSVLGWIR